MGHISHGVLAALFYLAIFNNFDPALATFLTRTSSIPTGNNSAPVSSLRIKPSPQNEGTLDSLIAYRSTNENGYGPWVASLQTFLEGYSRPTIIPNRAEKLFNCHFSEPPPPGNLCDVDVRHWYPCTSENHFGYHRAMPCIFLKLDTPPGWRPVFYNDTNSLPVNMPIDLKNHIINIKSSDPRHLNTVWVSCEGENPADVEFIGPIQYIPNRGFPGYYFLNDEVDGYLSPLVAVHFERPFSGILINIKCKAWAQNIDNNSDQGVGKFGLLID